MFQLIQPYPEVLTPATTAGWIRDQLLFLPFCPDWGQRCTRAKEIRNKPSNLWQPRRSKAIQNDSDNKCQNQRPNLNLAARLGTGMWRHPYQHTRHQTFRGRDCFTWPSWQQSLWHRWCDIFKATESYVKYELSLMSVWKTGEYQTHGKEH